MLNVIRFSYYQTNLMIDDTDEQEILIRMALPHFCACHEILQTI